MPRSSPVTAAWVSPGDNVPRKGSKINGLTIGKVNKVGVEEIIYREEQHLRQYYRILSDVKAAQGATGDMPGAHCGQNLQSTWGLVKEGQCHQEIGSWSLV